MHYFLLAALALLLAGCGAKQYDPDFSEAALQERGWDRFEKKDFDREFLQTFYKSCEHQPLLKGQCDSNITTFEQFQKHFLPVKVMGEQEQGLMTGYYEPLLHGSREKTKRYFYPLYEKPEDMYTVELHEIYPELEGYRLRGKIQGDKIVPYYDRNDIEAGLAKATPICYVDSKIDAFFLQVQGSGKVQLDSGEILNIGYADQNGHRYRSIGRYMYEKGYLQQVSLQSIKKYLQSNPEKMDEILGYNSSYVFFREREQGATGALGVELTPMRSVAVDRNYVPLGFPLYLKTEEKVVNRYVVAQDVGGAIKGEIRVDYFFGHGKAAERLAGRMKAPVEVYMFVPRELLQK